MLTISASICRTEQNVSLDQCKTSCIGDKSCKAFTYNPKVKWCFLKSDFKTMNAFPGAIAGRIVETTAASVPQEPDLGAAPRLHLPLGRSCPAGPRLQDQRLTLTDDQQGQGVDNLTANARLDLDRRQSRRCAEILPWRPGDHP